MGKECDSEKRFFYFYSSIGFKWDEIVFGGIAQWLLVNILESHNHQIVPMVCLQIKIIIEKKL